MKITDTVLSAHGSCRETIEAIFEFVQTQPKSKQNVVGTQKERLIIQQEKRSKRG